MGFFMDLKDFDDIDFGNQEIISALENAERERNDPFVTTLTTVRKSVTAIGVCAAIATTCYVWSTYHDK
jgi:hypothetical protein